MRIAGIHEVNRTGSQSGSGLTAQRHDFDAELRRALMKFLEERHDKDHGRVVDGSNADDFTAFKNIECGCSS